MVTLRKQRLCVQCKHGQLSRSFTVRYAPLPHEVGAGAPPGSVCSLHPDTAALAICERCGDFACYGCTTPYDGRYYCVACFDLQWSRGGLRQHDESGKKVYEWFSVGAGAMSLLCSWIPGLNFMMGMIGLGLAVIGIARTKPVSGAAIAALVLSLIGLGLSLFIMLAQ